MIKVLFLIEHMKMGGAENVLQNLVNHLDPAKFDVTVQTIWPHNAAGQFRESIHLRSCYKTRNRWTELLMRIEAQLKLTYSRRIQDDYDIECAFLEFAPTKILAASTNRRAKKVAWVHCDLRKVEEDTGTNVGLCAPWYQKYDHVVCVADQVRESFRKLFGDGIPSSVIHNVIDDDRVCRLSQHPVESIDDSGKKSVVTLGRLESPKNYEGLLRIHKRLVAEGFSYNLLILGKGILQAKLEQYIQENNLQDSVKMLGYIDNPYPYLKNADFLVCSSKYEGFSTFITEGLILGKAIVTTNCSGMKEQLGESEFGMITPNDEESLYQGMKEMLSNDSLRKHYEEMATQRGRLFSAQHLVHETEEFLLSLVKKTLT